MTTPTHHYTVRILQKSQPISAQKLLLAIMIMAILFRLFSAFVQGNAVTELPGIFDQVSYDSLAQRVADGYGFSFAENHWPMTRAGEPTAHWSFLYTIYLATIYALFGHQPVIARALQAVLVGGLQTFLMYLIAKKTFSQIVGLVAAGITAVYIYFVYYGGALMTEPFYITAILWTLYLVLRIVETEDRKQANLLGLQLGLAIAITIILRQVFLLFLPFLFLWMWFARFRRHLGLPVISTILSIGVIALCVLPITLYNQARFGRFVLLNTNSGYAFFWGNHPIYGTHFIPILPSDTYRDLVPVELRSLDEAALDQALLQRGLDFIFEDPKRYILLSLSRIPAFFVFWPSSESGVLSNISRVASFGVTLPFMLYGLLLAVRKERDGIGNSLLELVTSPSGLLMLFAVIYTAIHLLTWALIRYRLPVDAVLIPFAGYAFIDVFERVKGKVASLKPKSSAIS